MEGNRDDLMRIIQSNYNKLSKGQKLIAEFILKHYDKAAFMTASKLGTSVGVSESTVVRFANELGYECLQALKAFNVGGCVICESPILETDGILLKEYYRTL